MSTTGNRPETSGRGSTGQANRVMVRGGRQHSASAFAEDNAALAFGVCPRWAAHRRADPLFNLQPSWRERQSCMARQAEFALFLIAACARSVWSTDRFDIKMAPRTRAGASPHQPSNSSSRKQAKSTSPCGSLFTCPVAHAAPGCRRCCGSAVSAPPPVRPARRRHR